MNNKNKDITPYNDKRQPHGYCETFYSDGTLCHKGDYVDGHRHGYFEEYYRNGEVCYKGYYDMGKVVGYEVNVDSSPKEMFPIF